MLICFAAVSGLTSYILTMPKYALTKAVKVLLETINNSSESPDLYKSIQTLKSIQIQFPNFELS